MRRLLTAERHRKILERVASQGVLDFASLADELDVSSMTIRRDVRILEERGHIEMTRGGATAMLTSTNDILTHPRAFDQASEKSQIGQFAATLIERGEVIFLGSGSTTAVFAQFLPTNLDLTVITSSLPHASLLGSRGVNVISTGGTILAEDLTQTGQIAHKTLAGFLATRAIISAGGVSAKDGITEFDLAIAALNRVMIENAEEVICLVDSSKAGVAGNFRTVKVTQVDEYITSVAGGPIFAKELGSGAQILTPNW
jgi:DeoR family transcriptional regulator of aga operon